MLLTVVLARSPLKGLSHQNCNWVLTSHSEFTVNLANHCIRQAKKVDDFYEFFRSPWAFFLYHDQADELFAMVKELLPKVPVMLVS